MQKSAPDQIAGFRLPEETRLGPVRLRVSDLERSLSFYDSVLGMRALRQSEGFAALGAAGDDRVLVELHEARGIIPVAPRGRLGLYHFAILLPDRAPLGRFIKHAGKLGIRLGSADHLVSEALYLRDPDDLGIEVYADRPRDTWRRVGREVLMAADPLDLEGLLRAAGDEEWQAMPAGTVIGHAHLHVGDLEQARAFYSDALGFDVMTASYPGALFLGAGGYHHHLGTNTWAGAGARPTGANEAGLIEWTIELPDSASIDAAAQSLSGAGYDVAREETDAVAADPWGTGLRLRAR
ncbi:MAG TPA: VOC family protein [Gemmatimonadaceae bacterium]|nr:VOC family protein [Gemmatimonadaceae bacterium]